MRLDFLRSLHSARTVVYFTAFSTMRLQSYPLIHPRIIVVHLETVLDPQCCVHLTVASPPHWERGDDVRTIYHASYSQRASERGMFVKTAVSPSTRVSYAC